MVEEKSGDQSPVAAEGGVIEWKRKEKRDEKTLSFEERIALKRNSGFDNFVSK